ncbi:cytochrome P450 [Rhodococcus opacus]|nr:cytochrome P450 [Rhodococcus opacus]
MTRIDSDHAELLAQFDLFDDDSFARMPEVMEYARSRCPVAHTSAHGGLYMVTKFEDVKAVLSDPETYSSVESTPLPSPVRLPPLDVDPPQHSEFRKLLNPYFARPYLLKFEEVLRDLARQAIDTFVDRGEVEFVHDFAIPFSSAAAAKIVFDENDGDRLKRAVAAVERIARENSAESYEGLAVLAAEYLAERTEIGGDSIIAAIVRATVDGRQLTMEEQIGIVTVLFIGGLDTTRGAIGNIAAALAKDPSLEDVVRKPDWIRDDLDEFLRYNSPVLALRRLVTRDVVLGTVNYARATS